MAYARWDWYVHAKCYWQDAQEKNFFFSRKNLAWLSQMFETIRHNLSLNIFALNGLIKKYLKYISTSSMKRCIEHNRLILMQVEKHLHQICKMLIDISLKCIIIIDKYALYHCTTSSKSYCRMNLHGCGTKQSKKLIIVTFGVSTLGDKYTTHFMPKSAHPHALKNIRIIVRCLELSMIIKLKSSRIHCLVCICCTNTIELPRTAISLKIVHLMFVRPKFWIRSTRTFFWYQNRCIIFKPPNGTNKCQPLYQEIIWYFKVQFCCVQLNHFMSEYEISHLSVSESHFQFLINDHTHVHNLLG